MRLYFLFFLLFFYVSPGAAQTTGKQFRFFTGGSVGRTGLDVHGYHAEATLNFDNLKYLSAMAGAEWFPRKLPNLVVRLETMYKTFGYFAKGLDHYIYHDTTYNTFDGFHITPALCLLYDFIRKDKLRVYAGAGAGLNFTHFSKKEQVWVTDSGFSIVQDYDLLRDTWFSQEVRAGAVYRNVEAAFFLTKGRIGKEPSYVIDLLSMGFQLSYHL
jgi:hypothetical protein